MEEKRILVVEDDSDGQEVVSRMLRFHRIPVDVVGSAEEAMQQLRRNKYTGAVIDLALPGMNGWELFDYIHNSPYTNHIRCVAVTAFHSADVAVKAIEHGFLAYFPKPLEATSFVRELQRVME